MSQLPMVLGASTGVFTGGDMIFQLLSLLILLALLKKFALKPLLGIMKQREDYIGNEISSAEQKHVQAEKLLEEQRVLLKEAREESHTLIENAKKIGEKQKKRSFKQHVKSQSA